MTSQAVPTVAFQVDDRVSTPGFGGGLREWQIDKIVGGEALCHLVAQPKTETSLPLQHLRTSGIAPRRPSWSPLKTTV